MFSIYIFVFHLLSGYLCNILIFNIDFVNLVCQHDLLRMQESMATSIPQLARALPRRNIALDREGVAQYD